MSSRTEPSQRSFVRRAFSKAYMPQCRQPTHGEEESREAFEKGQEHGRKTSGCQERGSCTTSRGSCHSAARCQVTLRCPVTLSLSEPPVPANSLSIILITRPREARRWPQSFAFLPGKRETLWL